MKIETAKKIFKDRAENFYGRTVAWLADEMQRGFHETQRVTQAYNKLKNAGIV
jgi:hypothetical protein